jgi:hypothetical protein
MSRLIAELGAALEQRAGAASLALMRSDMAGAAHAPFLSHPDTFLAASKAFCDGR